MQGQKRVEDLLRKNNIQTIRQQSINSAQLRYVGTEEMFFLI